MATLLFYSPFYRRARDVESLMLHFKSEGHRIISLSQREGVDINPYLHSVGIEAYSYIVPSNVLFFFRHLIYFIRFCRKHNVDYVFSHLDPANFVASMGQYFVQAKVILNRHHIDEAALYNFHTSLTYKITHLLAKRIIVVSNRAMQYMIKSEGVSPKKLRHVNLSYDFSLFNMPDKNTVDQIRNEFDDTVLLLTACRLTTHKRPELSIALVSKLRDLGVSATLLILGSGDLQEKLRNQISEAGLDGKVFLLGHVRNVLDYMDAANFIVHPSILESSCVVIKEAGLIKKPVIACSSIGDFDDYVVNGSNGFLVDADQFVEQAADVIVQNFGNRIHLEEMGARLNNDVRRLFDVNVVISQLKQIMRE